MSSVNESEKRIFIHIPRCAGTSMERVNWNRGDFHQTIYFFKNKKGIDIDNYFKWCFVRNPWDRTHSVYNFVRKLNSEVSFEYFIKALYKEKDKLQVQNITHKEILLPVLNLPVTKIHFFPMVSLISIDNEIKMDFIGRYENLEQDWKTITEILKQPPTPLMHINQGRNKPYYKNDYTKELIDMVEEIYEKDIKAFNYTF